MEGGVAILLLLIIVVVGGGIAIVLYVTGGAIGSRSSKKTEGGHRPEHKTVSSPTQEKVRLAGTRQDHEGDS
jgi:hypothetical protein